MEKWVSLIKNKLFHWLEKFVLDLPNLIFATLIFVLCFFGARFLRKIVYRIIMKISGKAALSSLFSTIFYISIISLGLFISLEILHLEKTISSLLAGAGIIGLALGFAFQDLTANFISGVYIIFRKPFEVGHVVDTNGFTGVIEEILLRSTVLRTFQGLHVMLPNKDIFQKSFTNYSLSKDRRIDIVLTVPAAGKMEEIEKNVREAVAGFPASGDQKPAEVRYTDFDGSATKLEVWYWIKSGSPEDYDRTKNDLIRLLHSRLNPG
jgi:small conductance mechanosensitive channel